jgi:hypothetical protein
MKKILLIISLAMFIVFAGSDETKAQCRQQLVYSCATNNGGAIYLRDFNAKLKKARGTNKPSSVVRFSVVLNRGTHYRFNICEPNPGKEKKVVMKLYDTHRVHGSTFDEGRKIDRKGFDFVCQKSGVYYVSIGFKKGMDTQKGCAVGILSFVGKNK